MLNRRDFGAGLVPQRPGRATASRALASPLGLAWRLQRGSLIGWTAGVLLTGVVFGSFGNSVAEFATENPEMAKFLGGTDRIVDAFLAFSIAVWALARTRRRVSGSAPAPGQPFDAPPVRPFTNCFCRARKKMSTGSVARNIRAKTLPKSAWYWPIER